MADNELALLWKLKADNTDAKAKLAETRGEVSKLRQGFASELSVMQTVGKSALENVQQNLVNLTRQIPLVGGVLADVTREAIKAGDAAVAAAGRTVAAEEKTIEARLKALKVYEKRPALPGGFATLNAPGGAGGGNIGDQRTEAEANAAVKAAAEVKALDAAVTGLSKSTGKTSDEVKTLVSEFAATEGQAKKVGVVMASLGGTVGAQVLPKIEEAAAKLGALNAAEEAVAATTAQALVPELEKAGVGAAKLATATEGAGAALGGIAIPLALAAAEIAAVVIVVYQLEKALIENAVTFSQFGDSLDRASQKTKLTVEQLAALKAVAEDNEVPFDSLVSGLGKYLRALDAASKGNQDLRDQLEQLGIDADTAAKSPQEAVQQLFEAFQRLGPSVEENAVVTKLLGRSGIELIPVLRAIHGNLDEATAASQRFGVNINEQGLKSALALDNALDDLNKQFLGIKLAIGQAAAPAVTELVRAFIGLLNALRPTFGIIATVGIPIMNQLTDVVRGMAIAVAIATGNWAALNAEIERSKADHDIPAIPDIPSPEPVPLPTVSDEARKAQENNISALKSASEEAKRIAADAIANEENLFKQGLVTRQNATENIIGNLLAQADAQKVAIDAEIQRKQDELNRLDKYDSEKVKKANALNEELLNLEQQKKNIDSEVERESVRRRTEYQVEERKSLVAHENAKLQILLSASQARINIIESQVRIGAKSAEEGNKEIEAIEDAGFKARKFVLENELKAAGVEPSLRREIKDRLAALDQERTANVQRQSERRLAIQEQANAREREIQLSHIETTVRLGQISANAQIASIQALATARIRTEEQAAKDILKVRLNAIDLETEAVRAKLTATETIADPQQRARQQAELNNQIKVLTAERTTIEAQGARDIDAGRKTDLENERRYASDLISIKQRIAQALRDNQQLIIGLMVQHHARRRDIIQAQLSLDEQDETDRHQQALDSISAEKTENAASNRTKEEKAAKEKELNLLEEAEAERHRLAMKGIKDAGKAELELEDPVSTRSLLGDAFTENLAAIKQAALDADQPISNLRASFLALAQTAADSFHQMSFEAGNFATIAGGAVGAFTEGLGQMLNAWVLTGKTGPAALRKLTAEVLAQIAQQAAVKAIFELAEGLALLFVNPAASGAHFAAAALYGSVAGVAAVAGRAVAGNLFNQPGQSQLPGQNRDTRDREPIVQGRPQNVVRVQVAVVPDGTRFASAVTAHVVEDYQNAGPVYDVVKGG